ncbi:HPF/RaiA family ribosome-associated protein [Xenophilus arseniciresistens]|uniref:HPF/RaiA family ribosome-associated protein n=1 Tax=Xenophilus arseniciresistens TaxID=1283306 RepID=A0AAE3NAV6_9BURK|nr:HPF/RaiA family ribosome-associated protein [Xenophilus arseniciresistens]MDA7416279.1 HPF/RaiA family ribosome-associated protein [Xenophilus arseniciresistens]
MQIQLNTSNGIENKESLDRWADEELRHQLQRHADDLVRIEVHLSDENGQRASAADKRCVMEARMAGQGQLAATHDAQTIDLAFRGALDKLKRQIEHKVGRAADHRDRSSIRTVAADGLDAVDQQAGAAQD